MENVKLYEAMFLVDSALGGGEFPGVVKEITALLRRRGAVIRQIQRWSDRKLAFDIRGVKRGLYILVHFDAPTASIAELRHDIAITERLTRVLILRVPELPKPTTEMFNEQGESLGKPEIPQAEPPKPAEPPAAVGAEAQPPVAAQTKEEPDSGQPQ